MSNNPKIPGGLETRKILRPNYVFFTDRYIDAYVFFVITTKNKL